MRFAIGTVQFGLNYGVANQRGQVPYDEVVLILEYAKSMGIDTLDTAIAYGQSEVRLGNIGVADWQVITKLPAVPECCENISKWVFDVVYESLNRLKIDKLYALYLHNPNQLLGANGNLIYEALQKLKTDGIVKKIGASIYDPSGLKNIHHQYSIDIVQSPFNIFDSRLIESGWLNRVKNENIELHVRSVFLQGLLLMNSDERPKKFDRWSTLWEKYDKWLEQNYLSRLQACVRYAHSFPEITKIVIGVDSLNHLKEILEAVNGKLIKPESFNINDKELIDPTCWDFLV